MLPETQLRCSTAHGVMSVLARSTVAEPLAVCSARVLRGSPWPRDAGGNRAPDSDYGGQDGRGRRSRSREACGGAGQGAHLVYLKHLRALDLEVQRGTCPNPSLRRVTYVV